ncbi:MAG: hypothetical protein H6818_07610 [Phycisphaerales bacterium]|nr:hypothetical protein [Phycisphaerales bacterium]MCB9864191.1 hypothetical protein [Phycisphaerales bacterium]
MLKNATTQRATITAAMSMALLSATNLAHADGGRRHRDHRDADLDVSARIDFHRDDAVLNVKIKAEIEGRFLRDTYNVLLTIEPAGPRFDGRFVRPQTVIVPLNRPSKIDDDEIEFRQRVNVVLPRNLARFGNALVIRAELVSASSGRVLDRDTSFINEDRPPVRRQPRHRGPHFGAAIIW